MKEVDFVELATYCQNQFKERLTAQEEKYIGTTFVSISDNNEVKFSKTPHVLSKATQAILIHEKSKLALKYWYSWYEVGFVDPEGCVHESRLDGNFRLNVAAWGSNINQIMYLRYGKQTNLYWFSWPSEQEKLRKLWELYTKVKDINNAAEIELIAKLFRQDDRVFELTKEVEELKFSNMLLEQEKQQYKGLLDEIKEMFNPNQPLG